ncbi:MULTISPECIES: ABC transporter permease [unclassified Undibacterium]|uniref:ABC transporter permease n=1 Tax=unclassified Undibacterium TaxID=2630295 RepID=UPI002AC8A685|nr:MULTISPECIES: ABC transporter permease [unclassified Undibacterium]MEB0139415.1 ABC transporter permease [Undibacterium sp. CCC2.1]MEB0174054.1 ABC transporter permease [Undibacterium sp. CCC1.1]MEB0177445.1 ABC transporter permease [Undibacterium sp. CCC3.4]MEB0216616.1 ABC transporter permease [Undibacterium sp. 5I2]WPX44014.1 ABC transporter permease [Undibacterium sp. CCC3.4]
MKTIAALIARHILSAVLLLLLVSVLIFAGTQMLPGDVATAMLGQSATPSAIAAIRAELGLNEPALLRYALWLSGLMHGNFGVSYASHQDIASSIGLRLGNTVFLAGMTALLAIPLALVLGAISVLNKNGIADRLITTVTRGTVALPEFFVGYLLIMFFSVQLGWFDSSATVFPGMSLMQRLEAILLPTITLVLAVLGHMINMIRAALLNILSAPYIEMARLKGLSRARIVWHHTLPNALAPIMNVIAINLAYLLVGVVVVEVVFVYPGMGQYMVDSVIKRDIPVVQATALIFAAIYIGLNRCADIAILLNNPRLRYPR